METIWLEIVKERLRRNCQSSLIKYLQQTYHKSDVTIEKDNEHMKSLLSINVPIVSQHKFQISKNMKEMLPKDFRKMTPLSMILLNKTNNITSSWDYTSTSEHTRTWQGFGEFKESYKKYSKGELH